MSEKNLKKTDEQKKYLEAKKAQYEAEKRPSKLSDYELVCFIERDGRAYPVYRDDD